MRLKEKGLKIMHYILGIVSIFFLALMGSAPVAAETQWDVGVSGGSRGIDSFDLSVSEYYAVPEREVVVIHDRGIHDEELPVVFYIAQQAQVSPDVVVGMRLKGMNWMDITLHFGLEPDIYYVPVPAYEENHWPYGHAYGYYRGHHDRDHWKHMALNDRDIVDQVNLIFMSNHYQCTPDQVMRYRGEGRNFIIIDQDLRKEYGGQRHMQSNRENYDKHEQHWGGYDGSHHGNGYGYGGSAENWNRGRHGGGRR